MRVNATASWMISITLVIILLIYGQPVIVPFVFALLIWFVVKKLRDLIDKIQFVHKYIPRWIKSILASLLIFGLLVFISKLLIRNIEDLAISYDVYSSNITHVANQINELFSIDVEEEITKYSQEFMEKYLSSLLNSLSEILGNMVMIVFYIVFLFVEESLFQQKFKLMFSEKEQYRNYLQIFTKIDRSMSSYISLKSLISLMTTTLSYFILLAVGIDSPLFWAFLIFIFNFIPSVGPIMGTLLPAAFSLIQFGEFIPAIIILFGVGGVATLIGSLVEPRLMGNTLNISPLVAIISLAVWGSIWGIIGMLLSVPITVAMIIIMAQFKATRPMAILLSEKGTV
jgi:predicted PurR-regulated permease PerM